MAQTLPNGTVVPDENGREPISATGIAEMRALGSSVDAQLANRSLLDHNHDDRYYTEAEVDAKLSGKADVEATELAPGTDADTLTTPGVYYESNSSQAGPNFPAAIAGVFTVTADPTSLHVHQRFISFGSVVPQQWYRSRYEGAWSAWRQVVTEERLAEVVAAKSDEAHTHEIGDVAGLQPALDGKSAVAHKHPVSDVDGLAARLDALEYDSGERDITGLIPDVVSGALHIERVGSTVWIDFRDLVCVDPTSAWHEWKGLLPTGFRPSRSWKYRSLTARTSAFTAGPARVSAGGDLLIYDVGGQKIMRGLISFPTPDPAPTTPFGSPA